MTEKLGITFGILIAHFIPGLILLLSGAIAFFNINNDLKLIKEHYAIMLAVGSMLSLACGLILDACRYLLTQLPKFIKRYREWCKIDISKANEDERKYHDWIIEHNYRFHQFYGNLSLALMSSAIVLILHKKIIFLHLLLLCGTSIICAISAVLTYYRTISYLREKFPKKILGG